MNLIEKSLPGKIEKLSEENERLKDEIKMLYSKLETKERIIDLNNLNMDSLADTNKDLKKEIERLETLNKYLEKVVTRLQNEKERYEKVKIENETLWKLFQLKKEDTNE